MRKAARPPAALGGVLLLDPPGRARYPRDADAALRHPATARRDPLRDRSGRGPRLVSRDGHRCVLRLSQVRQRVRPRSHSSATRIAEVLAELELLHDDTTAAIRTWIDRGTGELPDGFRRDIRAWLVVLLDGDARARPRSHTTLRVYFGILRPFIEHWAATCGHLREITSSDIDTVLEPLRGHRRYNAITALRSLFRFAKRRGLTFADPTRHLEGGRAPAAPCCR